MTLQQLQAAKPVGHNVGKKMCAFTRASVAGVGGTVIAQHQARRRQRLRKACMQL
jgi:hypothetical protein